MTQDGAAKDDVRVPEGDLGKQIQADFDEGKDLLVTIVSAMGEEQVSLIGRLDARCELICRGRLSRSKRLPREATDFGS